MRKGKGNLLNIEDSHLLGSYMGLFSIIETPKNRPFFDRGGVQEYGLIGGGRGGGVRHFSGGGCTKWGGGTRFLLQKSIKFDITFFF